MVWLFGQGQGMAQGGFTQRSQENGCLSCHRGTEEMHPWMSLSCVDCHGGNDRATTLEKAHVLPLYGWPGDERMLPSDFDPEALRFRNPTDLRIVETTCAQCHDQVVGHLLTSLHGTTAGHLSDGLYENGLLSERESLYGIFNVASRAEDPPPEDIGRLLAIDRLHVRSQSSSLGDHFADLPRKACMQCHLFSEGVAVRGRLGQDGLYRGAGCAACHVVYAENGLSLSADQSVDHQEPGHPRKHQMVAVPPTTVCTTCHVGDASIGNGFRGLAHLYPNQGAGPEVPGPADRVIAGQFFLKDSRKLPADVHYDANMQCTDCHGVEDVMGDGNLYGAMEHGVAIECVDCHGTFREPSNLHNSKGDPLENLERVADIFRLKGKVDGRWRRVKQARDVLDPSHPDYNPRAAEAMTPEHAGLECYACHSGWNTNFFGFHFDRNEAFSQLDIVTGQRTPGRVSTQERIFATLRQFVLGVNSEGMIAPYMVGFSTMGTVRGPDGQPLPGLDQALPETAAGLSGMTMIHHQTHTVQSAARSCVDCHRSPATWGLGTGDANSSSYSLTREILYAVGERGLELLLLDRENPIQSDFISRLPLGGAQKVIVDSDVVTGHASTAFVTIAGAGVAVVDVRNPAFPRVRAFVAAGDARDATLAGNLLLIANGLGGMRVVDVSDRDQPVLISDLQTSEARGLSVQWPRVLIADGPGGLAIADISVPAAPRVVGHVSMFAGSGSDSGDANAVAAMFVYGTPVGHDQRTESRMIAVVANGRFGMAVADVTEPSAARLLSGPARVYGRGRNAIDVQFTSRFELGDTVGLKPTTERDMAYITVTNESRLSGSVLVVDLTNPDQPVLRDSLNVRSLPGGGALTKSFNPPELVIRHIVACDDGLVFQDVTQSDEAVVLDTIAALSGVVDLAVENFSFDRMIDETGNQLKDISHASARFLTPAEIFSVLSVPSEVLGTDPDGGRRRTTLTRQYAGRVARGGLLENSLAMADTSVDRAERLLRGYRLSPQEDMARLVRHLSPREYDRNGDDGLGRAEMEELIFDALDANGDNQLDILEWPRHPSEDIFVLDRNHNGSISRSEMDLEEDVIRFYDLNGDGLATWSEWPWLTREQVLPTLFYATGELLAELIKDDSFQKRHSEMMNTLESRRRDGFEVDVAYLTEVVDRNRARPLTDVTGQLAPGGFIERFDLDADGSVEPFEYPPFSSLATRCDLNGDGKINERDLP